ncbi:MAG: GNAT family N-acetyltransferase, partial [Desulfobacterales bacterium]
MLNALKLQYTVKKETLDSLRDYWGRNEYPLQWNCLFVLPVWLKVWWHHFGHVSEPFIFSIFHEDRLIGLAPLQRQGQTVRLMGDDDVCDYLDFVVTPERATEFYGFLLDYLKQEGITRLELSPLRPDSSAFVNLITVARKMGYGVVYEPKDVSFELELPGSWDDYLNTLTGKERHEIRRKFRRLNEAGNVQYRRVDNIPAIDSEIDTFLTLFKSNRSDKAIFMNDPMRLFFQSLATVLIRNRIARFFFLELDGKPVAAVMCFDYQSTRYLYNSGYDLQYRSLSVGLLSKVLSIKEGIQSRIKTYDFLKGSEIYKQRLGGKSVPLYQC